MIQVTLNTPLPPRCLDLPRPPLVAANRFGLKLVALDLNWYQGWSQFYRLNAKHTSIASVEFVVILSQRLFYITIPREIYMLILRVLPATYVIWRLPSNVTGYAFSSHSES